MCSGADGFFFQARDIFQETAFRLQPRAFFFQETAFFFAAYNFFLQPLWSHLNITLLKADQSKVQYCVEYIAIDEFM